MPADYVSIWLAILNSAHHTLILPIILYTVLCSLYVVFGFIGKSVSGGLVVADTKISPKAIVATVFISAFVVSVYNGYSDGTLIATAMIGLVPVLSIITYGVLGQLLDINDPYESLLFYVLYIFIPTAVLGLLLTILGYFLGRILSLGYGL